MSLKYKSVSKVYEESINYIERRYTGDVKSLKLPWETWNESYMNGWEWGWIVTIPAMSGTGKTSAWNMLETELFDLNPDEEFEVLSFNFEMLASRLVSRKISTAVGKTLRQIYSADTEHNLTKEELDFIKSDLKQRSIKHPIHYVELPGSPKDIADTILQFIKTRLAGTSKGLIVSLDHATLVKQSPGFNERGTLMELMSVFNEMKKRFPKSLYVVLSQLNRKIESYDRRQASGPYKFLHYPQRGDIFGSEALFQFSDAVIVLHRPELLGLQKYGPGDLPVGELVYCHHLKNRDGVPKITALTNKLAMNRLEDYRLSTDGSIKKYSAK